MIKLKDGKIFYRLTAEKSNTFVDELSAFLKSKNVDKDEIAKLKELKFVPQVIAHDSFTLTVRVKKNEVILLFETLMGSEIFYDFLGSYFK